MRNLCANTLTRCAKISLDFSIFVVVAVVQPKHPENIVARALEKSQKRIWRAQRRKKFVYNMFLSCFFSFLRIYITFCIASATALASLSFMITNKNAMPIHGYIYQAMPGAFTLETIIRPQHAWNIFGIQFIMLHDKIRYLFRMPWVKFIGTKQQKDS